MIEVDAVDEKIKLFIIIFKRKRNSRTDDPVQKSVCSFRSTSSLKLMNDDKLLIILLMKNFKLDFFRMYNEHSNSNECVMWWVWPLQWNQNIFSPVWSGTDPSGRSQLDQEMEHVRSYLFCNFTCNKFYTVRNFGLRSFFRF